MLYSSVADIPFTLSDLPSQELPRSILMVTPEHYQVEYVLNPYMKGNIGSVDQAEAHVQWSSLRRSYLALGIGVNNIRGVAGSPDMVFAANQTLPGLDSRGGRRVLLSNMADEVRRSEVDHFGTFFLDHGYDVVRLSAGTKLEGCGDGIWHHDLRLLWCGHGFRSDPTAFEESCALFDVPGNLLELRDEAFYHLDTCLAVINRDTALWVRSAFSPGSVEILERLIPHLIEVPLHEAGSLLACNAHSPDGKTVVIQSGCDETNMLLRSAGFSVKEVDTSEFLKAGGSVFCMKQMYW